MSLRFVVVTATVSALALGTASLGSRAATTLDYEYFKAKVQPIVDQMKPQLEAIHKEAMEKMKAIMESTGAQIRPLLTPQQQEKYDAIKKAHEDMHKAMQEMHDAQKK